MFDFSFFLNCLSDRSLRDMPGLNVTSNWHLHSVNQANISCDSQYLIISANKVTSPRLIIHLYNLSLGSVNLTTFQIRLVNSIKQTTWFVQICHTFQARSWLSWTVRTEKPWLTDTPCSCIGAEAPTCICSITVSKHANINRFVRPGCSYAVPAPCTITTWLLEASSTTKLARQTWSAATIMEQHLKSLLLSFKSD